MSPGEQFEAIRAIWMTASHQELGRLLSGDTKQYRRLGFNFSGFGEEDERARNGPKTIEFRHLEGTLDSGLVLGWMHICCTLLEVAVEEPSVRFDDIVRALLRDSRRRDDPPDQPFTKLMEQLKIGRSIYNPFQRKMSDYGDRKASFKDQGLWEVEG